ncbi:MAG: hypothetical protein BWX73_03270 [Lentisphaerae bacterium ADurb.Bin082]|nr:MAG: hypothetical protein BWX73_03270 [Lentisphaerae bacterium ADurb.Bin082]HQL87026.1 hypothetical protein [Lentisphaeria bacterium]
MKIRRLFLFAALILCATLLQGGGSVVPVGTYLYADLEKVSPATGALVLNFDAAGPSRLVVAYGRKHRKDRKTRDGTTEAERESFKPRLAVLSDQGRVARFDKLPPDYYDIAVIDATTMTLHEGIALYSSTEEELTDNSMIEQFQGEIRKSLGLRDDRIGGWEGFFDTKQIERIQVASGRAGVLMQQMRLGTALAESGAVLKGCIHSIDVVWVERAIDATAGWQVINRQQLYRDEIPARTFFKHIQMPELSGIRVGTREKKMPVIKLP